MKKPIGSILIVLFLFNTLAYALPFDSQKLLGLRPLLSERLKTKAEDGKYNKLWPALVSALVGAAIISANQNQSNFTSTEDQRLNNLEFGWLFLTLGTSLYLTKTLPEVNPALLTSTTQPGLEREKYSYLIYKNNEAEGKSNREAASFIWSIWGLGIALLPALTPNATKEYRTTVTVTGFIFAGLGAVQYFFPSEAEREMKKIDAELK
jgi:hypothetical protein